MKIAERIIELETKKKCIQEQVQKASSLTGSLNSIDRRQDHCQFCGKRLLSSDFALRYNLGIYQVCDCTEAQEAYRKSCELSEWTRKLEADLEITEWLIEMEKEKIRQLRMRSNLGKRYLNKTFESFQADRCPEAYQKAYSFAKGFRKEQEEGLLLIGPPGTGKTHLAAAIANYCIDQYETKLKFGNFVDILESIRQGFRGEQSEAEQRDELLRQLQDIPLLIIDDLGKERTTEWTNEILYRIINHRYSECKPIVITTNLAVSDLEKTVDPAVISRIIEMCRGVVTKGTDYRRIMSHI